jgi:SAM-dependent methyltransferase
MKPSEFWENKYQAQETGWDLQAVSPPLKSIIDSITDKNTRILIPGCGNAYEAGYLVELGFTDITVIDIAPTPVAKLKNTFSNNEIQIILGDFFDHSGQYDLILEQTFFCALNPDLRKDYAQKCYDLLKPNGSIRGVLFNIIFEKEGPPFGGTINEYRDLFSPLFNIVQMDKCSNSVPARMGNEIIIELTKKIKHDKYN